MGNRKEVTVGIYTRYNSKSQPPPALREICDAFAKHPSVKRAGCVRYDDIRSISNNTDKEYGSKGCQKELRDFLLQTGILIQQSSKAYYFDYARVPEVLMACDEHRDVVERDVSDTVRLKELKEVIRLRKAKPVVRTESPSEAMFKPVPPPKPVVQGVLMSDSGITEKQTIKMTRFQADAWETIALLEKTVLNGKRRVGFPLSGNHLSRSLRSVS